MTDRYFVEPPITADRPVLAGPEAHHLIHVMRARPGERVVLFDGSGAEFPAVVERVGRAEVALAVLSRQEVDRELPVHLTLGVALPKGDRQKWLVEKAVELGVGRIVPLKTARAVAQPGQQALQRLRRTVIEASKQCGRNRLMEIVEPQAWADFLSGSRDVPCRLLAHPHSAADATGDCPNFRPTKMGLSPSEVPQLSFRRPLAADCVLLAVGPEGGFTDEEVALAMAAGWRTVHLGPRILRVETAALLLVALVVP
jgi:16S rRNA (uracil1498-N3)-methyltransferase